MPALIERCGKCLRNDTTSQELTVQRALQQRLGRVPLWLTTWALLWPTCLGCSRAFYRRQADRDVYSLVDCGARQTGGSIDDYAIEPPPESRMFDPGCPDDPPMPPDDPVSHRLMHCVDAKQGWPGWDCTGKTPVVENPDWMGYLPYREDGTVTLDQDGAVQMAWLQSPDYQDVLENLYLAALGVTFEQFQFDVQFFGGNDTFFTADGPQRGRQSLLRTDTDLALRKQFAAGGELVAGAANSLMWQFAGPDTYNGNTLLDFSLVQPLLRAGGRAVVLEDLTDSQRQLLARIRSTERFRRSFYTDVSVDFLGLLEEQIRIGNQQGNVSDLQASLERLVAVNEAGRIARSQVDRARQELYTAQSRLLSITSAYQTTLDSYKLSLGLPPDLAVRVDDPLLRRFDLIDPQLTAAQQQVKDFLAQLRDAAQAAEMERHGTLSEAVAAVQQTVTDQLAVVEGDMQLLLEALPERRKSLRLLAAREEVRQGEIAPSICDVEALDQRVAALGADLATLKEKLNTTSGLLESLPLPSAAADSAVNDDATDAVTDRAAADDTIGSVIDTSPQNLKEGVALLSNQLLELSLIQARARLDTVTLTPIEMSQQRALETARTQRRDWKNARASLVDTWRQIQISANALKSTLDLRFEGDLNTTDNNPIRFRSTTGRLRVGLEFDAPLTRLQERNDYRAALIDYQRARRDHYSFADGIAQSLRLTLRTIRRNQMDFEVNRAGVLVAIARVDEARLRLIRPPKPGETSQFGESFVENLLDALRALLNAQNEFLRVWVNQEIQRRTLQLDLGTMELDDLGMWIDPGPIGVDDAATDGAAADGAKSTDPAEADLPPLPTTEEIPAPAGEAIGA